MVRATARAVESPRIHNGRAAGRAALETDVPRAEGWRIYALQPPTQQPPATGSTP